MTASEVFEGNETIDELRQIIIESIKFQDEMNAKIADHGKFQDESNRVSDELLETTGLVDDQVWNNAREIETLGVLAERAAERFAHETEQIEAISKLLIHFDREQDEMEARLEADREERRKLEIELDALREKLDAD